MLQELWHTVVIWTYFAIMESYRRLRQQPPGRGGSVSGANIKKRRGKRTGIHARLKANPSKPAVPSPLHSNVYFTETWLYDNIPDAAI